MQVAASRCIDDQGYNVLAELKNVTDDPDMRGVLLHNEPMAEHTSWRTGGAAEKYYVPADIEDLGLFLSSLDREETVYWLGLGSNLLVRDGGIRGTVIAVTGVLDELSRQESGLRAGAGVTCAKVARFSAANGFTGAEFLAGIPGTMGGALAMNAGAFGGETWGIVESVEIINRKGEVSLRQGNEFKVGYRNVALADDEWFVSATLRLEAGNENESRINIRDLLRQRNDSQPTSEYSCGSVFRNPEADFAGRLIESCGLKGKSIGGASVSEKHANFIINSGSASAADIEDLIEYVQQVVMDKHQVKLHTEVQIIGEPA